MYSCRFDQTLRTLHAAKIFDILAPYSPVCAGTIPLGVDISSSDADIICEVHHHAEFQRTLTSHFSSYGQFHVQKTQKNGLQTTVARFCVPLSSVPLSRYTPTSSEIEEESEGVLRVEVFGQARAVWEQQAVRHLMVETRLLWLSGESIEEARAAIRAYKAAGMKTEPAFAQYYGIEGEPFAALLELSQASDEELRKIMSITHRQNR